MPQRATFEAGLIVRAHRGNHSRAGEQSCDPRRDRRGARLQADRRAQDDFLQPLGPRQFRHGGVRQLSERQARGFPVSRRCDRGSAGGIAEGRPAGVMSRASRVRATRDRRLATHLGGSSDGRIADARPEQGARHDQTIHRRRVDSDRARNSQARGYRRQPREPAPSGEGRGVALEPRFAGAPDRAARRRVAGLQRRGARSRSRAVRARMRDRHSRPRDRRARRHRA